MPKNKNQRRLVLIGFLVILAIVTPFLFIRLKIRIDKESQRITIKTISIPEAAPVDFQITNLSPSGFTVSWMSVMPGTELTTLIPLATSGQLILGINSEIVNDASGVVLSDKRGENYHGVTHYINVRNLQPDTLYYFKIKSGPTLYSYKNSNWQKNGAALETFTIKTLPIVNNRQNPPSISNPYGAYSLETGAFLPCHRNPSSSTSCYRPNPLIFLIQPATADTIIYLTVKNNQQPDGVKISTVLSCLIQTNSSLNNRCLIDMANFWKEDLSTYLPYQPGTNTLRLKWIASSQSASQEITKPIPEVIADGCLTNPLNCSIIPTGERLFILNLDSQPTPTIITPTPTVSPGQPTPTGTIRPTPTTTPGQPTPTIFVTPVPSPTVIPNTPFLNIKLNFFGVLSEPNNPSSLDYKNQDVLITIKRISPAPAIVYQRIINFTAKSLNNSFYYENTDLINPNITPDNIYLILIKGPKHLQIKLPRQNLTTGQQYIDITTQEKSLPGGDLPLPKDGELVQDGMVNSMDYNSLVEYFNNTQPQILKIGDLNLDGIINTGDTAVLANTLDNRKDEDE